jgi:hypothetical protein
MFLIPNAIFHGSPDITVGLYIWKGVLPALLGNILGGGFFVGILFWYLHLQGHEAMAIDGIYYEPVVMRASRDVLNSLTKRRDEKATTMDDERV